MSSEDFLPADYSAVHAPPHSSAKLHQWLPVSHPNQDHSSSCLASSGKAPAQPPDHASGIMSSMSCQMERIGIVRTGWSNTWLVDCMWTPKPSCSSPCPPHCLLQLQKLFGLLAIVMSMPVIFGSAQLGAIKGHAAPTAKGWTPKLKFWKH